jgi:hypothetical protein
MSSVESIFITYVKQLAAGAPLLLVYLAGMVLALVLWRRSPTASLLCLIGMGLLLVAAVAQPLANLFVIRSMSSQGWGGDRVSMLLSVSAVIGSLVRAVAMGLLVGAVFSGRGKSKPARAGVPVEEPVAGRPPDRGITRSADGEAFTTDG